MEPVLRAFECIRAFIARYCGSKIKSGYKFEIEKTLTREEALPFLPYACAAAYGYNGNFKEFLTPLGWTPILPFEIGFQDSELLPNDHSYFDKKTGLKISFAEKGGEVLIVIPGLLSSAGNEKNEVSRDIRNGLVRDPAKVINLAGGVPYVYVQAERAIASLLEMEKIKGKRVTLVGQCFGGSIVSYVALKRGMNAICLNSLQLGAGLQAQIGDEALKKADTLIQHLLVENDWLTRSKIVEGVDRILTFLHVRTPGNFGKKYLIPTAYASCFKSHGFVLGSLMVHLGHDKRATPRTLSSKN
jgi:dienelactone hydrolase